MELALACSACRLRARSSTTHSRATTYAIFAQQNNHRSIRLAHKRRMCSDHQYRYQHNGCHWFLEVSDCVWNQEIAVTQLLAIRLAETNTNMNMFRSLIDLAWFQGRFIKQNRLGRERGPWRKCVDIDICTTRRCMVECCHVNKIRN